MFFFFFNFISFAFPKYNNYNKYNYYHKAYMHTPKHTCNSTITTQGNAHCYFTSAIQKKKKKLIIFTKEEKLPRLQSPFVH